MQCKSCRTENAAGAEYCKQCGTPLGSGIRTCPNGHNYESTYSECPYCPKGDYRRTELDDRSRQKTALDEPRPGKATLVDPVSPSTRGSVDRPKPSDKTVIYNPADAAAGPSAQAAAGRKLVGWIVTYDIQSNGTDFRIFEGRSKIGRSGANDIVINQPGVSETHCLLLYRDRKLCIQDEMSSNGTFVNGVSIEEKVVLNDNDMVTLGKVNFKVKLI